MTPINWFRHKGIILTLGLIAISLAGCDSKNESLVKKTGEALGKGVTDFATGIGQGIDQKMLVNVTLDDSVKAVGLTNTVAKSLGIDSSKKGFSVYLIANQTVTNTLVAIALNSAGTEIGRSKVDIGFEKDAARYIEFSFDTEMDSAMVKAYQIRLAK